MSRTTYPRCSGIEIRAKRFDQADLVLIRTLIRQNPTWGRTRLSEEICKRLDWRQANGRLKDRACRVALLKLESLGYLNLPARKVNNGGKPPKQHLECSVYYESNQLRNMPRDLAVRRVRTTAEAKTWNGLIARNHYLSLATPVGRLLRYLVYAGDKEIGAISFSEAAWGIIQRDQLLASIGIARDEILRSVISNNRFLILPNVRVKNLASRVLSISLKNAVADWETEFEVRPKLAETFVDLSRFTGTCYRAANWILIGQTKGYSKRGSSHHKTTAPKWIFVRGLNPKTHAEFDKYIRFTQSNAA